LEQIIYIVSIYKSHSKGNINSRLTLEQRGRSYPLIYKTTYIYIGNMIYMGWLMIGKAKWLTFGRLIG